MQLKPDISLIISSFERPANLLRCLHSIAVQKGVKGRIEVVIANDGFCDETEELVRRFDRSVDFPIKYVSHEHNGFRLSQCRNEGVLASTAEYILFTDADCVLPSNHVSIHLQSRRRNRVVAGHCYHLDAEASDRLSVEKIHAENLFSLVSRREARRAYWKGIKARVYESLRVSMRPRLSGSNMGVWRTDCERVNGFDENFVGWGMEDTDFQRRLESIGVRSSLARTGVYHLWHPQHPTCRKNSKGTANYDYYHRPGKIPFQCENGLNERRLVSLVCNTFNTPLPLAAGDTPGRIKLLRGAEEAESVNATSQTVAVLIPTLGRPDRVVPLLNNLNASTACDFTVYFIVEQEDTQTIEAVQQAGAGLIFNYGQSTYASCINTAYCKMDEPYLFLGADDIVFVERWLEEAMSEMADLKIGVVGTADPRHPLPNHSAHSLVRRRYIEEQSGCMDLRDTVLYPYLHGFTDHELVGVAKSRHAYVYCEGSQVEHHHPGWDSLGRVRGGSTLDATYRKGNRHHQQDTITFIERSRMWSHLIDNPGPVDIQLQKFIRHNRGMRGAVRFGLRRFTDAISEGLGR